MTPPFQAMGLDHLVLRIADVPRALDFYCGVLGCRVERETAKIGLTQVRAGRSLIDLVTLDGVLGRRGGAGPAAEGRNLDHFALAVVPFDEVAIRAHLAAHGVEIVEAGSRFGAEGEGPSIYIRDPDGNTVELKGPPAAP
jgi:catechol 2,3-dioxygenase-like lactoylglutathione lyase family enzyme